MANKLTTLCELQLYSILQEVGTSGAGTARAACLALAACNKLEQALNDVAQNELAREALGDVTREVNTVIINLQFMDELSQRVGHILQLFSILKRSLPPWVEDQEHDEEFVKIATRIFSMEAEFAVLKLIFPGCNHVPSSNDTEIF